MNQLRILYHLMRADFLERTRRHSFLIVLGLVGYLGYIVNTGQLILRLGEYRGVYNSAWLGSMMAMVVNLFLGWFGFYLVKNAVERDARTGVGQILATTPITRLLYTFGKWLSNLTVLGVMVVILMLAAIVMQVIRREVPQLDLWALLAPFLFVALPLMTLVSAAAVLFETIDGLRGGWGNVVYFFGFILGLTLTGFLPLDPIGWGLFFPSMSAAAKAAFPAYEGGIQLKIAASEVLQTFYWPGIDWTPDLVLQRLMLVGAAAGIVLLAAVFFNRFDPSRERKRKLARQEASIQVSLETPVTVPLSRHVTLSPVSVRFRFGAVLLAELRLMLQVQRWWWYVVAVGLILAGALSTAAEARGVLLAAWIWPLLVWSSLGCREARHATRQIVFSVARPLARQLPATWLAGVIVTAMTGSGVALSLMWSGDGGSLWMWLVGVLFIPSLALALGVVERQRQAL